MKKYEGYKDITISSPEGQDDIRLYFYTNGFGNCQYVVESGNYASEYLHISKQDIDDIFKVEDFFRFLFENQCTIDDDVGFPHCSGPDVTVAQYKSDVKKAMVLRNSILIHWFRFFVFQSK